MGTCAVSMVGAPQSWCGPPSGGSSRQARPVTTSGTNLAGDRAMPHEPDAELAGVPVLIVEDETATAEIVATILATHGYETRIAGSAEEAIAILGSFVPRAIVLDLVLPRMSGLVLAEQLRQDPATRDIPIIATSQFSAQDAKQIARDAGCADYVRKPIDPQAFARLLRDHIDRAK
jgi:CheY-like chemotaxis protein